MWRANPNSNILQAVLVLFLFTCCLANGYFTVLKKRDFRPVFAVLVNGTTIVRHEQLSSLAVLVARRNCEESNVSYK